MMMKQECDLKFTFARTMELKKKELNQYIEKGNFGHAIMQVYFRARQEGLDHDSAKAVTLDFYIGASLDLKRPDITDVYSEVESFIDWFATQKIKVLHVEEPMMYTLPNGIDFWFTADLIVEYLEGPLKGTAVVFDWKFTGQFWSKKSVTMVQQLPKYSHYVSQIKGYKVKKACLTQINTRSNRAATSDAFRNSWVELSKEKLERLSLENERMAEEVREFKSLSVEEQLATGNRAINPKTCGNCFYADDICPALLNGKGIKNILALNYVKTDYSYDDIPI